ncbi:MFS transporter [Streptomyces sp. NPDC004561]
MGRSTRRTGPSLILDASGSAAHLVSRRSARALAAMVIALAATDYLDRQIIVSAFPYLKHQWRLSDAALGSLVSVVSITIAVVALPTARLADRWGRVRSIAVMGGVWSLAALGCAVSGSYAQLFGGRALLGAGEAGYGPAGAALLSSYFPQRRRATVLGAFQAAGPLGTLLGAVLGGLMIARLGWRVTLGAFGVPGLLLALLFLRVRDYRTPEAAGQARQNPHASVDPGADPPATAPGPRLRSTLRQLFSARTAIWCYLGGALNLVVLSTFYTWLPSYLSRAYGLSSTQAGTRAGLVILAGVVGAVVLAHVADRRGAVSPGHRLLVPAVTAAVSWAALSGAFAGLAPGSAQFALIVAAGFPLAATLGTAPAAVVDVVIPSVRATAVGMVVLVQNLFGLAVGPVLTGWLSDTFGLRTALAVMPVFCLLAAVAFWLGSRTYEKDCAAVSGGVRAATPPTDHEMEPTV